MSDYLIFVDTNIFLDFYRVRHEIGLTLLSTLDGIHDRLITSCQVEMEFKKNRQRVILDYLRNLKDREKVQAAAFLAQTKSVEVLNRNISESNQRIQKLRTRLKKVLQEPTKRDPVYKVVQRMFRKDSPLNLSRNKEIWWTVRRLALRRFMLGYPPRKPDSISIGDAINWEWMIHLAQETGKHVLIVSRDTDYGVELDGRSYINDWLIQEFRDRVSKKRQCVLFNRLAPAFKLAGVKIAQEVEEEEEELARQPGEPERQQTVWPLLLANTALLELLKLYSDATEPTTEDKSQS